VISAGARTWGGARSGFIDRGVSDDARNLVADARDDWSVSVSVREVRALARQYLQCPCPGPGEILVHDDVVALFAYDRWANTKVLDACRQLTAQQYVAGPAPGWSSVRSTVYHIALVTDFHLRTLAVDPDDSTPTEADLATADDAARLLGRAYRRFEGLRPTLTPGRLNAVLTLRRRGRTAALPPWAMLRHIVNHSTYHRGQVAAKLKRFGVEQPATDFFFWVIEQAPQGA
jgi:uncharacterized damage-inducible protein DinB